MADPFVAEIRIYPFNFAPRGWAFCDGQLLPISQNTALFSLLGTTYGGNGQTTQRDDQQSNQRQWGGVFHGDDCPSGWTRRKEILPEVASCDASTLFTSDCRVEVLCSSRGR